MNMTLYTDNLTKDEMDPETATIEVTEVNEKVMKKIPVKSSKLTDNSTFVREGAIFFDLIFRWLDINNT